MKKLLILLFSILISLNSYGGWKKVYVWEEDGDTVYLDYSSLKINNGHAFIWSLMDKLKPSEYTGHLSSKVLMELDCNTPLRGRIIARSYFDIPMGKGTPSRTDNVTGLWETLTPDSVKIFAKLCK